MNIVADIKLSEKRINKTTNRTLNCFFDQNQMIKIISSILQNYFAIKGKSNLGFRTMYQGRVVIYTV